MTDGQVAEPPPGTPGKRALGAMESAVRRAREAQGASHSSPLQPPPPASTMPPPLPVAPPLPPRPLPVAPPPRVSFPSSRSVDAAVATNEQGSRPGGPDRWLFTAVVAVAVLVVIASAALAASITSGPPTQLLAPGSAQRAAQAPSPLHGSSGGGATSHSGQSSGTSTTTTTPSVSPSPGGPPVISGLAPATGAPGQGIQVSGTNFLSPNGQIVALFNGQVAPTSCPAQNTCTVTVPPMTAGASSAQVTITTADGTSNAVTFTYS
jgi:IPT/TIG domain